MFESVFGEIPAGLMEVGAAAQQAKLIPFLSKDIKELTGKEGEKILVEYPPAPMTSALSAATRAKPSQA